MIDVVFLLLVFFMLAARFGQEAEITLTASGGEGEVWQGPPRLIDIAPEEVSLNGQPQDLDTLQQALTGLMETESSPILLRPDLDTSTQRLLDVMAALTAAGFNNLVLVQP